MNTAAIGKTRAPDPIPEAAPLSPGMVHIAPVETEGIHPAQSERIAQLRYAGSGGLAGALKQRMALGSPRQK
jgi:hypothetical protein